jgi:hypothetical protein
MRAGQGASGRPERRGDCGTCGHFRNDAAFLEASFPGLTAMSSAYADVRLDDGLCTLHDVLLRATASCSNYRPA